jgi:Fe-S-cluster containining protein
MLRFKCNGCGKCCGHLLSYQDDLRFGLYLSPKEALLFPEECISPLFKYYNTIIAYQVSVDRCPHLTKDNKCAIYDNRPLTCQSFPMVSLVEMAAELCPVTSAHKFEEWDLSVMQSEISAIKTQAEEAVVLPQATAMYLYDKKQWIYERSEKIL